MQVYLYCADLYCQQCGEVIRTRLDKAGIPIVSMNNHVFDKDDEYSYDSDEYPKGPYPDGGGEADYPQHCGSGPDCVNAIELSDGRNIGVWLENDLTAQGIEYVREAIRQGGEVAKLWEEYYANVLDVD